MATTINGVGMGKVTGWSNQKNANIIPITIPGQDSEKTETVDGLGVLEAVTIRGRFTGTFDQCQAFLQSIKSLCNGYQTVSYVLSSDYVVPNTGAPGSQGSPVNINVKVNKFEYNWEIPGQTYVDYQVQLIIGGRT